MCSKFAKGKEEKKTSLYMFLVLHSCNIRHILNIFKFDVTSHKNLELKNILRFILQIDMIIPAICSTGLCWWFMPPY